MPLVSVIINISNGAATLPEAVNSVLAQTLDDWELIAWDDCSTDGSAEVLARYSDSRIRYFRSGERVPLGQARQRALDLARGEWVAFLDQDDIWLPHKLERQMAAARDADDVALVYGRTVRFYSSGMERDYDQDHEYTLLPEGAIFAELFTNGCFIAMSSAMFRRSAIQQIGGIPETISIIPDYYLYTTIARRFQAAAVQEAVCRYRMHAGNTLQVTAIKVHEEALRLMDMWQGAVEPQILARCKQRHSTALALAEMRDPRTLFRGFWRLLRDGSVLSQLLRPFYFVFHFVRRSVRPPLWKTINHQGVSTRPV